MINEYALIDIFSRLYQKNITKNLTEQFHKEFLSVDTFIVRWMPFQLLFAMLIAIYASTYLLAFSVGAALVLFSYLSYRYYAGRLFCRIVQALCLFGFSALYIQEQVGYVEPHFQFYLSMFLLMLYKDIVPLLVFAVVALFYHITFTYLQSISFTLMDTPILIYTWGLWDAFSIHIAFFFISFGLFTSTIYTNMKNFLKNQELLSDLEGHQTVLENRVKRRTVALTEKIQHVKNMLRNLSAGVFTIDIEQRIQSEYSPYLETILERNDIANNDVNAIFFQTSDLGSDILARHSAALSACLDEDEMMFDMNGHQLTQACKVKIADTWKDLEFEWNPICNDDDVVEKLLVTVRDVTELKALQNTAKEQTRWLQIIGQILSVSADNFSGFIRNSKQLIAENKQLIEQESEKNPETLEILFRNLHTVKGNARTYGFLHLTNHVHEAEEEYSALRKDPDKVWEPQKLLQQLHQTLEIVEEYEQLNRDKLGREGMTGTTEHYFKVKKEDMQNALRKLEQLEMNDINALRETVDETYRLFNLMSTQSIDTILEPIINSIPALAKELEKASPLIKLDDNNISIKHDISSLLQNVFMHMFRNSLDHGIEKADEREANGKQAQGQINLIMKHSETHFTMHYYDDGKGLNLSAIRKKAIEKQILQADEAVPDEEVASLIFHSGLSTTDKVTEVSGRGVGMDAVKKYLIQNKGDITIKRRDGASPGIGYFPLEFIITLPAELAITN